MGYCLGSHSLLEFFSEGICDKWLNYSVRQELQSGLSDDIQIPGKTQKRCEYSGTKRRACDSHSIVLSVFLQNYSILI